MLRVKNVLYLLLLSILIWEYTDLRYCGVMKKYQSSKLNNVILHKNN